MEASPGFSNKKDAVLSQADSLRGTNACACAALSASICVNNELSVTLRDCLYWALTLTCST